MAVLRGSDARRLDDDVVDDSGDDHEVGEEDEGVDGHGGGEAEGRQPQAEARRAKERERKDAEGVEDRIHGIRRGIGGGHFWGRRSGFWGFSGEGFGLLAHTAPSVLLLLLLRPSETFTV